MRSAALPLLRTLQLLFAKVLNGFDAMQFTLFDYLTESIITSTLQSAMTLVDLRFGRPARSGEATLGGFWLFAISGARRIPD